MMMILWVMKAPVVRVAKARLSKFMGHSQYVVECEFANEACAFTGKSSVEGSLDLCFKSSKP